MATTTARALEVESLATRFAEPLRISGYVFDAMPSVLVRIGEGRCVGGAGGIFAGAFAELDIWD